MLWPAAATLATVAALGMGYIAYRHVSEDPPRVLRFTVPPPETAPFGSNLSVSPDGHRVAFAYANQLLVRDLDTLEARALAGTEGATYPFWSPDSRYLGFFTGGKLKKMDVSGGPALTICDAGTARGGTWNKNDVIVFAPGTGTELFRVGAAGGQTTPVTTLDKETQENAHRRPWFLPDGRHFLYTARSNDPEKSTIYVGDLESKSRKAVVRASSNAVYAPPGYLLFARGRILLAQPFDAGSAQTTGDAVPVAEPVFYDALNIQANFGASQNGVLAYVANGGVSNVQLTWMDRSGKTTGTVGTPGDIQWPAISPDGKTVAFDRRDPQNGLIHIWLHDLARGTDSRFGADAESPVWSPDGARLAFRAIRPGFGNLFQRSFLSTAVDEPFDNRKALNGRPEDWSRDGRYIVENVIAPLSGRDIWLAPLFGDKKPVPYLSSESNEGHAKVSPDSRFLAYQSNETGRNEVYVQTFPMPGAKVQISSAGGIEPIWSRDGKELFFIADDRKMMAVQVRTNSTKFEAGLPAPLFDSHFDTLNPFGWYDVARDGRFLIPTVVEQSAAAPMTVVVNWTAGLKK